jgi:SAM-dependent methyltransferase
MSSEIISQRNFWNNEADSFQRIYSHEKSPFSNYLDKVFRKDMYERFAFTIENCEPVEGRSFLDVGCGNGLYSLELARRGADRVVGIDIAEGMLELCKKSASDQGLADRCTFLQTDLLAYTPRTAFNVSFGIGLFDYISNPLRHKAIMSFPRLWTWRAPVRKARLTAKGCSVYFYTKERIESLMREAGFESHSLTKVGKLYCVVAYSPRERESL